MAKEVKILSEFRDRYLLKTTLGKWFVSIYEKYSPPLADYIKDRDFIKHIIRIGLVPVIAFGSIIISTNNYEKIIIIGVLMIGFAGLVGFLRLVRSKAVDR